MLGPAIELRPEVKSHVLYGRCRHQGGGKRQHQSGGKRANHLSVTRASSKTDLRPDSASGFAYSTYANNVPAINSFGFLPEEARTNQLSNSAVPATQTTGSLATGVYTLWVNGAGSAQMSAGTATGCGTDTATNGTPVNFTITVAGTCTVTVTGALNAFQLELGSFGTSFIVCVTAPCTRAADVPQLIGPAATAALAAKAAFFQTTGIAGGVSPRFLEFQGGAIAAIGSTTQTITSYLGNQATGTAGSGTSAGIFKSAHGFDASSMTVRVNGGSLGINANSFVGGQTGLVYLSNRLAGDRALNGYMQHFALSPTKGVFDGATAP